MSFADELRGFAVHVRENARDIVTEAGIEVHRSVTEGSEITGAPGQPVDVGTLKGSFIEERVSDFEWQDTTGLEYAIPVEDDLPVWGGKRFTEVQKSPVGGSHSVALTEASWTRIVDVAAARVTGE